MFVTALFTTPVKGMRMHEPDAVDLEPGGARGDRDFLFVDDDDRLQSIPVTGDLARFRAAWEPRTRRLRIADGNDAADGEIALGDPLRIRTFADETRPGRLVHGPWSEWVSGRCGRRLRLVKTDADGGGSDVEPVTLLGDASVDELGRQSGLGAVDRRRFRMLIHFAPGPAHVEDSWDGRIVDIGTARLRAGGLVPRCAATTRDPDSGRRDAPIVKAIKAYRGVQDTPIGRGVPFGIYAEVLRPGRVAVGDRLAVLDA